MEYCEMIKNDRKAKKLTQGALADRLSLGMRTIQKYETGEIMPPLEKRIILAEIFSNPAYLSNDETKTLHKNQFLTEIGNKFGMDARSEAKHHIDGLGALFAGGRLAPEDQDALTASMMKIILDVQERKINHT